MKHLAEKVFKLLTENYLSPLLVYQEGSIEVIATQCEILTWAKIASSIASNSTCDEVMLVTFDYTSHIERIVIKEMTVGTWTKQRSTVSHWYQNDRFLSYKRDPLTSSPLNSPFLQLP